MIHTHSAEETIDLGRQIGGELLPGTVVLLEGDLGAGKTTFVKGVAEAVSGSDATAVSSPTFVYLNIYEGKCPVYHFDLYRLKNPEDFLAMGFDEMIGGEQICCIEWPEKLGAMVLEGAMRIRFEKISELERTITVEK